MTFFTVCVMLSKAQPASPGQDQTPRDLRLTNPASGLDPTSTRPQVPRGYALVIGVGRYKSLSPEKWLTYAESDADAMYRTLISQQGGAFPAENVHILIGSAATLTNVRRELEQWLPSVSGPQDRVVVYFAGHGFTQAGVGYLAVHDLDPANIAGTGLPMRELGEVLANRVKSQWKALFVDACHSGMITPESNNAGVDQQLSSLPSGFLTFTATREREQSFEDPKLATGFGLFTYFLTKGLSGAADADSCDGIVTADELIDYVRGEVQTYARSNRVTQTPTEHGDFDNQMVFASNPSCVSNGRGAQTTTLVIETPSGVVDVYIDGGLVGRVSAAAPLNIPGLSSGLHVVMGVRPGFETETKHVMVVPGQQRSVTLRVQYRREYKRSAVELVKRGQDLLFGHNSTINPGRLYSSPNHRRPDLLKAKDLFLGALIEEPRYAAAAHYLALTYQQLSQFAPMLDAFRKAVDSDASYAAARIDYAGALIEEGDPDEAIRQLLEAKRLDPSNDLAYAHLSRAYLDKEALTPAIEMAARAIQLNSANEQAHLWKADALRRQAAKLKAPDRRPMLENARTSFGEFIRLTTFHTRLDETIAFYAIGFHLGSRSHADRQASYAYQRGFAFMGLCDVDRQLGSFRQAISHCEQALKYDDHDPLAFFLLGNAYRDLYNATLRRDYVIAARKNYSRMVQINPELPLSRNARDYIEQIDARMSRR